MIIYNPASTDDGTFSIKNVSIKKLTTPIDAIDFVWNTERNNLMQNFHKRTPAPITNAITTIDGHVTYVNTGMWHHDEVTGPNASHGYFHSPATYVWNRDASSQILANRRNLYLLTKSLDFGNHSLRKVIQSIHFTYKSNGANYLIPFVKAYYLDGTSPATYYMCTSGASSITTDNLHASNFVGILPTTSDKYETYKYQHVLSSGVSGDASSMRSVLKNVGAIQIGLVKIYTDGSINADFSIEEISVTYRDKNPK